MVRSCGRRLRNSSAFRSQRSEVVALERDTIAACRNYLLADLSNNP
jgi:hypothetical protein